jgi:trimeric autotransporter adhesin
MATFLSGSTTTAQGFCPDTTGSAPVYYPSAGVSAPTTYQLAATFDGKHILGADNSGQLTDISIQGLINSVSGAVTSSLSGTCPQDTTGTGHSHPLTIQSTYNQTPLGVTPTEITGVLPSADSTKSFITYNGTSATGLIPVYMPSTTAGALGTMSSVQLSSGAQAPLSGAFSPDNFTFFVGTTGDNLLHLIDVPSLTDTQTINPKLPSCVLSPSGGTPACDPTTFVPIQFIAVQPRPTT